MPPELISSPAPSLKGRMAEPTARCRLIIVFSTPPRIRGEGFVRKKGDRIRSRQRERFPTNLLSAAGQEYRKPNETVGGPGVGMYEQCNSHRCASRHATCVVMADGLSSVA